MKTSREEGEEQETEVTAERGSKEWKVTEPECKWRDTEGRMPFPWKKGGGCEDGYSDRRA